MKTLGVGIFIFIICGLVKAYVQQDLCPEKPPIIILKKRPITFSEWSSRNDQTHTHFEDLFSIPEPTRFKDPSTGSDELILPNYQKILEDDFKNKRLTTVKKIIQHSQIDSYLRLSKRSDRYQMWNNHFKPNNIPWEELEQFRISNNN